MSQQWQQSAMIRCTYVCSVAHTQARQHTHAHTAPHGRRKQHTAPQHFTVQGKTRQGETIGSSNKQPSAYQRPTTSLLPMVEAWRAGRREMRRKGRATHAIPIALAADRERPAQPHALPSHHITLLHRYQSMSRLSYAYNARTQKSHRSKVKKSPMPRARPIQPAMGTTFTPREK